MNTITHRWYDEEEGEELMSVDTYEDGIIYATTRYEYIDGSWQKGETYTVERGKLLDKNGKRVGRTVVDNKSIDWYTGVAGAHLDRDSTYFDDIEPDIANVRETFGAGITDKSQAVGWLLAMARMGGGTPSEALRGHIKKIAHETPYDEEKAERGIDT